MVTVDELAWTIGKTVRTEDDTMFNCGAVKATESREHKALHRTDGFYNDPDCSMEDKYGGEGLVEKIVENPDGIFLMFDWGYGVRILPTTIITEVRRGT